MQFALRNLFIKYAGCRAAEFHRGKIWQGAYSLQRAQYVVKFKILRRRKFEAL